MIRLNNKGQSLVMFILVMPIFLLMFVLVFNIGNAIVCKQELDNVNYLAIEYGLNHINEKNIETKLIDMINLNSKLNMLNVYVEDNQIKIISKKNVNGILTKNFKIIEIESEYKGYIENGKKIIERL